MSTLKFNQVMDPFMIIPGLLHPKYCETLKQNVASGRFSLEIYQTLGN